MRIGSVFEWKVNAYYRSMVPLEALRRRGHEVAFANGDEDADVGVFHPERLRGSDVIHAYRFVPPAQLEEIRRLRRRGAAFVWDTDDDLETLPKESPDYAANGGRSARAIFRYTVEIAREADVVTTSTSALAERYRAQGVERIEVLANYLPPSRSGRARRHRGIVVGWVAGLEHAADVARIPVVDALRRLLDEHGDLRVESVGLRLDLPADRYTHVPRSDWVRLGEHIAGWDIAIAPLADIPFNRTRSDIKLKEYASLGVPWLASPIGPYAGRGENEGGRLVADDGWQAALGELIDRRRARARLGKYAKAWAKTQQIDRYADRWELVCEEAVARRAARGLKVAS